MYYLKTVDNEFYKQRLSGPLIFVIIAFVVLIVRLFYLQIIEGGEYYIKSENNCVRLQDIPPPRGLIFDCNGKLLVDNRPSFDISVIPKNVKPLNQIIPKVAKFLELPENEVIKKIKAVRGIASYKPLLIKRDVGRTALAKIEANKYDLPGIIVDVTPRRHYIHNTAAHLIGYMGEISKEKINSKKYKNYRRGEYIGRFGIEKSYEKDLRGKRGGRQVEVNVKGQVLRVLNVVKAHPGHNIYLSIDAKLQKKAEELFKDKSGAVVAMNPSNGMILAMLSSPYFDQNMFVNKMTLKQWSDLVNDKNNPLQNKAIHGEYPPGSVYKIVTAMAGLEEGIVTQKDRVDCPGYYRFGNRTFRCWKRGGHGSVNIIDAIAESCDVYFYQLGQQIGVDRLSKYAKSCGLSLKTGIELDHEEDGLIPTSFWKLSQKGEPWIKGETLSIAIGQGYNLVTPLQIACLISAIANGGTLFKPLLINKIETVEGELVRKYKTEVSGKLKVSKKNLRLIRKGLWNAVNKKGGTAYWNARLDSIQISGKTGTSQVVGYKSKSKLKKGLFEDHAWFAAYAPTRKSKIAVAVLVEHGGHGSSAAAPIAKELIKLYCENKEQ